MKIGWKIKLGLMVLLALPSFIGWPVNQIKAAIIPGVAAGGAAYFMVVNLMIPMLMGLQRHALILGVTALISIPIVFGGACISYLFFLTGLGDASGPPGYSAHYVSLGINMLTVIPLSLGIVALIPLQAFEYKLLQKQQGVSIFEKSGLMFLRVFNHVVYFVIPDILEVLSEERQPKRSGLNHGKDGNIAQSGLQHQKIRLRFFFQTMIQLGIEGICASIQYIPLWAVEIGQLPKKGALPQGPQGENKGA